MNRLMTKPNKIACAPNEESDQPGHLPSLIIAVCMKTGHPPDLSLHWVHSHWFCHEATQI